MLDERGTELGKAIEHVYRVFGSYRVPRDMKACPCCSDLREIQKLCDKPLRELTSEDLHEYTFNAMTTAGDADDFRYFLPRILELLTIDLCGDLDAEVVLGKLGYGKWMSWPEAERRAIERILREVWRWIRRAPLEIATSYGWEMDHWLCGIARTGHDVVPYLEEWEQDRTPESCVNLKQFLEDNAAGGRSAFWDDAQAQWRQLRAWITARL